MKMKNILALALVLVLCLGLVACGGDSKGGETKSDKYSVSVVDSQDNPVTSGVIVRVLQDGQQVAMQVADEQGVAQLDLADGDYTVELKFTDANASYHYDAEGLKLSASSKQLTVKLYNVVGEGQALHAPTINGDSADTTGYQVAVGSTYLTPVVDARNYYLFYPTQAGTYTFVVTEGEGVVNYYGAPHFVQKSPAIDLQDGVLTISVSPSMIGESGATSAYVLGLDAKTAEAILTITRIGDHKKTIEEEPWTEYPTTHTPTAFTFQPTAGKTLTYVDIINGKTEDYNVVLGSDGFYHMGAEDGPLVYINLGKKAPNVSFYLMINGDGVAGGSPVRKYYFDEEGNFLKKEDYTQIMLDYIACMDEETGLYPLTEDLVYIIQTRSGWWTESSPDYIFDGCNPELGWLFACCFEK